MLNHYLTSINSQGMEKNPLTRFRNPAIFSGNHDIVSGNPNILSGNPNIFSGNDILFGNPDILFCLKTLEREDRNTESFLYLR